MRIQDLINNSQFEVSGWSGYLDDSVLQKPISVKKRAETVNRILHNEE